MNALRGPADNLHVADLRAIANSIEAAFPSAADTLRGIARELSDDASALTDEALRGPTP